MWKRHKVLYIYRFKTQLRCFNHGRLLTPLFPNRWHYKHNRATAAPNDQLAKWTIAFLLNLTFDARLCEEQIVNYVGVQCEVQEEAEDCEFRERLRKIPLPEELMRDGNDDEEDM